MKLTPSPVLIPVRILLGGRGSARAPPDPPGWMVIGWGSSGSSWVDGDWLGLLWMPGSISWRGAEPEVTMMAGW